MPSLRPVVTRIALVLAASLSLAGLGAAQQPGSASKPAEAGGGAGVGAGAGAGQSKQDGAGLAAFERALKAYAGLKTYRHSIASSMVMKAKNPDGTDASQDYNDTSTLVMAREGGGGGSGAMRFKSASRNATLASDGTTLTTYMEPLDQYTQAPMAGIAKRLEEEGQESEAMMGMSDPIASVFLRSPASGAALLRGVAKIKGARAEELKGRPGTRVDVEFDDTMMPGMGSAAPAGSVWFDQGTGLIGEVRTDLTAMYRDMYANMPEADADDEGGGPGKLSVEKAEWTWMFTDVVVDGPVSEADVAFTPPSSAKKVERFDYGASGRELAQLELIGKPAPDFTGELIKEGTFTLASLKGRVVVMDFWATWCGPCVAAIPSMQKMSERFKDQPVTVVGINQDRGEVKKVMAFLEKKKIDFAQVNDKESAVNSLYKVTGIPTCVIIDKDGVIQDIHVGGTPDLGEEIGDKVEKLLKGEKILDAKELAERIEAAKSGNDAMAFEGGDDGAGGSKGAAPAPAEPVSPDRLIAGERTRVQYMGMGMKEADVDGDGNLERLMPTGDGRVAVVKADGTVLKTLRFKGAGNGSMIQQVDFLRVGGEGRYLAAVSRFSRAGNDGTTVAMYNDEGEVVWKTDLATPKGMNSNNLIAVGNLVGDDNPEIACLQQLYGRNGRTMTFTLTVFDTAGQVLTRTNLKGSQYVGAMWVAPGSPRGTLILAGESLNRYTIDMSK